MSKRDMLNSSKVVDAIKESLREELLPDTEYNIVLNSIIKMEIAKEFGVELVTVSALSFGLKRNVKVGKNFSKGKIIL